MYSLYELREILENNIATVTFVKVDGTIREMRCTLRPDLLPKRELLQEEYEHLKPLNDTLPVWDLDINGWRSFKIDNIQNLEIIKE